MWYLVVAVAFICFGAGLIVGGLNRMSAKGEDIDRSPRAQMTADWLKRQGGGD